MTTIQLTIPDEVAAALVRVAESRGRSAEEIAVEAIQKQLDRQVNKSSHSRANK